MINFSIIFKLKKFQFLFLIFLLFSISGISQKNVMMIPLERIKGQGTTWVLTERRFYIPKAPPKVPILNPGKSDNFLKRVSPRFVIILT